MTITEQGIKVQECHGRTDSVPKQNEGIVMGIGRQQGQSLPRFPKLPAANEPQAHTAHDRQATPPAISGHLFDTRRRLTLGDKWPPTARTASRSRSDLRPAAGATIHVNVTVPFGLVSFPARAKNLTGCRMKGGMEFT